MGKSHKQKKKSTISGILGNLMRIDFFGEETTFKIEGSKSYPGFCGALFSIAILVTIIDYSVKKSIVMS